MKHIFLTGRIQIGKSTVIKRCLEMLRLQPAELGGFLTVRGPAPGPGMAGDGIYIVPPAGEQELTDDNLLFYRGRRGEENTFADRPAVFDTLGVKLLTQPERCSLILMDELGLRESGSYEFQRAVLARLDGDIPVIGVVQPRESKFLDLVRGHPSTEIIEVTSENRDALPQLLLADEPLRGLHQAGTTE